jgi:hypothetical protein
MPEKAILRDVDGEFLATLCPSEVEHYSFLAERGMVVRSQKMKKGRMTIVFRMKAIQVPVKPSKSPNSDVMLTFDDTERFAGCYGEPDRMHVERWRGWGLIGPCSKAVRSGLGSAI